MIATALFLYSARAEERNMTETFLGAYPVYVAGRRCDAVRLLISGWRRRAPSICRSLGFAVHRPPGWL